MSPDGCRAVSASDDRTLQVWDIETGRALATLEGHTAAVRVCAFTPDGAQVISASDDRTVRTWDLATGRPIAALRDQPCATGVLAVSSDGRRVVSMGDHLLQVSQLPSGDRPQL